MFSANYTNQRTLNSVLSLSKQAVITTGLLSGWVFSCSAVSNSLWPFVTRQALLFTRFFRQKYSNEFPFSSSRGSCQPWDWTHISCLFFAAGFFTHIGQDPAEIRFKHLPQNFARRTGKDSEKAEQERIKGAEIHYPQK